jgi:uncharacterized phiE125 gp8 family phage protein
MLTRTSIKTITPAADNCLTAAETWAELKIDGTPSDAAGIAAKLDAAERLVEEFCNRRLMLSTYDFTLSRWPQNGIVLPFSPILSIVSIKYYDSSNVLQTWATTNYHLNVDNEPTLISYVNDVPDVYENRTDAITVQFTTGYSSSATLGTQQAAVPAALKAAILKIVTDLYYFRNDGIKEKVSAWQVFAYPYRVFHFPIEND